MLRRTLSVLLLVTSVADTGCDLLPHEVTMRVYRVSGTNDPSQERGQATESWSSCANVAGYRDKQFYTSPANCSGRPDTFSSAPSIMTIIPRGRLGNHLHSYSILLALQERYI